MRYDEGHKAATRASILESASTLLRGMGIAGTTVAKVMAARKLTVGGFYKHFDSQDELFAESLAVAMRDARARLYTGLEPLSGAHFERGLIDRYLSAHHYHQVKAGCPVAALATELSRLPSAMRRPLKVEIDGVIDFAAARCDPPTPSRAWLLFSTCVGVMVVCRAIGGAPGERLLEGLREQLKGALHGEG
ncbi:MAG: TetR/AcrR family transcriptional regulator [Deltaproteobacteria bacterium]|nr:TetR/AcrR family transcriptional regulator [Deltaproteobacteria bacterium]